MSLPKFPKDPNTLTLEDAIGQVISSIAMEEVALSRILHAESDKINFAVKYAKDNPCPNVLKDLERINTSVTALVNAVNDMQMILKAKLQIATGVLGEQVPPQPPKPHPPKPPCPPPKPPCPPPKPPCPPPKSPCPPPKNPCGGQGQAHGAFVVASNCWEKGSKLKLKELTHSDIRLENGIITLPAGGEYRVVIDLEMYNPLCFENEVDVTLYGGRHMLKTKTIVPKTINKDGREVIKETLNYNTRCAEGKLYIRLLSEDRMRVLHGHVTVYKMPC